MNVIELTRELGKAIQADERYLNLEKAITANEADTQLNEMMTKIQLLQMQYQQLAESSGEQDKLDTCEKEFNELYTQIMQNENMKKYEAARNEIDQMMDYIMKILALCVNGEDPATCEPETHYHCDCGCSDCSHCG